ncbi:uncharacterized protein B0H18DRAFT_981864, partial [Fomitopsis serialis]|uniref:uncharacterized protein n=1 Tax=Fomitopsis serialis TaxID=139415 RepID=UPI0020087CF5
TGKKLGILVYVDGKPLQPELYTITLPHGGTVKSDMFNVKKLTFQLVKERGT